MSFKLADVKPLHKISKKVYDDNFRSVFILFTLSKTVKKVYLLRWKVYVDKGKSFGALTFQELLVVFTMRYSLLN